MTKRRNKKKIVKTTLPTKTKTPINIISSFQSLLIGGGILALLLPIFYDYLIGDVSLEFIKPLTRGYEFQINNNRPYDISIKEFRVTAPLKQKMIFKTTKDVFADKNDNDQITLPGGNSSYIPAVEFKELDGHLINSKSSDKFRIPPLSSRPWLEPEATIIDIKYTITPSNSGLSFIEKPLEFIGFHNNSETVRYLVIGNY